MQLRKANRSQQIAIAASIEMLEIRRLLAVGDFAQVVGGQLVVTGDAAANTIVVTPNEATGQLDASLDGQTLSFNPAGITSVAIDGGDGNDTISLLSSRPGQIDGGLGDDTILSSSGADSITGSDGNDSIDSGSGDDTINGDAGNGHDIQCRRSGFDLRR
jgi:Ca2+-binding RTX toxin-like protein